MLAKLSATFACGPRSRFPLTSRFVRSRVRSALALTVASFRTHRPQPLSAPFHVATADLVTDGALLFTARAKNVGSCRGARGHGHGRGSQLETDIGAGRLPPVGGDVALGLKAQRYITTNGWDATG